MSALVLSKSMLIETVILLLVFTRGFVSSDVQTVKCEFPSYAVNTDDPKVDFWTKNIRMSGSFTNVKISSEQIIATHLEGHTVSLSSMQCVRHLAGNDVYLVNYITTQKQTQICLQFIRRSDDVIQFASGQYDKTTSNCSLTLDPWPLIMSSKLRKGWTTCPNLGEFDILVTDVANHKVYCNETFPNPRMSSECLPGEGFRLQFPDPQCIPQDTGWSLDQALSCVTTWSDDEYTYTVVTWSGHSDPYCVRLPINSNITEAFIYQDFVCLTSKDSGTGIRHLQLDMIYTDESKCADNDEEFCSNMKDYGVCTKDRLPQYCRETCGYCEPQNTCTFSDSVLGGWSQKGAPVAVNDITVNSTFLNVDNTVLYSCVDQLSEGTFSLVTQFTNGCRPRFSCVDLQRLSPATLLYRISQSKLLYTSKYDVCDSHQFSNDVGPVGAAYRSVNYKTFISNNETAAGMTTECGFHGNFIVKSYSPSCDACALSDCDNPAVTTIDCCKEVTEFDCLSSRKSSVNNGHFLIMREKDDITCWVRSSSGTKIYVINGTTCDEDTEMNVISGRLTPVISLDISVNKDDPLCHPKTTTPPPTTTKKTTTTATTTTTTTTEPPHTTSEIVTSQQPTSGNVTSTPGGQVKGLTPPEIAGVIVGGLLGCVVVILVIYIVMKKYRQATGDTEQLIGVL